MVVIDQQVTTVSIKYFLQFITPIPERYSYAKTVMETV